VVLTTSTDVPFVCPIAKIVDAVRFIRYILSLAHAFSKCDIEQKKRDKLKNSQICPCPHFCMSPRTDDYYSLLVLVAYCVLAQADN